MWNENFGLTVLSRWMSQGTEVRLWWDDILSYRNPGKWQTKVRLCTALGGVKELYLFAGINAPGGGKETVV
jgi:hypothetical protein